jgi:hypothetical protein
VIDDEAKAASRSGYRERLAPIVVYIHYTGFAVSCKYFPKIKVLSFGIFPSNDQRDVVTIRVAF